MNLQPFTFNELIFLRASGEDATRVMARFGDNVVTYKDFLDASSAYARLFLALRSDPSRPPRVAVMMRNNLEFLFAYGGTALSGGTLFAVNAGLGGETLAEVVNRSEADVLLVDAANRDALRTVSHRLRHPPAGNVLDAGRDGKLSAALKALEERLGPARDDFPEIERVGPETPWVVIYTSGTTGLPKGIVNTHGKLRAVAQFAAQRLGLTAEDVGYVSMPLFHSNSLFLNWLPAFAVGASIALQEKFTASGFVDDVFRYGATYWNYVGQPVHYVLEATARQFGPEDGRILSRVRDDPRNRMRTAVGTGAGGPDRTRFIRWFGLDHVYEMYGSTEAEISTTCMPGDPIDSVGEVIDPNVAIIGPEGRECPPAQFDQAGNVANMREAVGEIVRRGEPSGLFQGYHGDAEATARKFSGGMYHSGDLGMCSLIENRRYLYFVGRTSDWIRKDGENFSAECVVDLVSGFPGMDLAAAYGAPHPVSDEWVMVALRMRDGRPFDPQAFFDHCEREVREKGRDAKWFPDLVRVVRDFPWTETHKILTRQLKTEGYDPRRVRSLYIRRRGDRTYRELTNEMYAQIEKEFGASGRLSILNSCV